MSTVQLVALLPLLVPAGTAVVILLAITLRRNHLVTLGLTLAGLILSLAMLQVDESFDVAELGSLLILDDFAYIVMRLLFGGTIVVVLLSYHYLKKTEQWPEEYYVLIMLATLGCATLSASAHFVTLFLGLELLSLSLVVLMAYLKNRESCVEAGIKYLVPASVSSAFLLFGFALIYAGTGTMELVRLANFVKTNQIDLLVQAGLAMVAVGLGFKLALVPFHLWTSDVYQGACAPVTSYVATVSKGAVLAVLIRVFVWIDGWSVNWWWILVAAMAVASMTVGNLLALLQTNLKRLLAYSSIAHMGYVLVALLAGGKSSLAAAVFYLLAYMVMSLGAFGVVTAMSGKDIEIDQLDHYRGLGKCRPALAGVLTLMLLSLAGIPLTAGFTGKLFVLVSGVGSQLWFLVIVLVINSTVGLFYYLRVVVVVYMTPPKDDLPSEDILSNRTNFSQGLVLAVISVLVIWLGVYPHPFLDLANRASTSLF